MENSSTDKFRNELLEEVNLVRTNPQVYSAKLRKWAGYVKGKVLHLPSGERVKLNEGVSAFENAAMFLDNLTAVEGLVLSPALTLVAQDYVTAVGELNPDQINELNLETYIEQRGEFVGNFAQSMDFGSDCAELVVINLLADDGEESRPNRTNLLDPKFKHIGLAKGGHKEFKHCSVLFYTQEFIPNAENVNASQSPKKEICENLKAETSQLNSSKENLNADQDKKEINEITSKLRAAILENKNKKEIEAPETKNTDDDCDFDIPEGYIKIEKQEKIVIEGGLKKKVSRIVKYKEDGTKETEITKENV